MPRKPVVSELKIEQIAIPSDSRRKKGYTEALRTLRPGTTDSVLLPVRRYPSSIVRMLRPMKFTMRMEAGGVRVWRIS